MNLDVWSSLMLVSIAISLMVAALTAFTISRTVTNRRLVVALLVFQLGLALWTIASLGCYLSTSADSWGLWIRIYYLAVWILGPIWISLPLSAARNSRGATPGRLLLLALPGGLVYLAALANAQSGPLFGAAFRGAGTTPVTMTGHPLDTAITLLAYGYVGTGILLFAKLRHSFDGWLRRMRLGFGLAANLTLVVSIFAVVSGAMPMDPTPLLATLATVMCTINLGRYWMKDVVRTALSQAAEQMGDAIVVTDPDGVVLDTNRAFEEIVKMNRQSLLGITIAKATAGLEERVGGQETLVEMISGYQERMEDRVSRVIEITGNPDRTYSLTAWPIRNKDGVILGRAVALRDVTAAQRAARELAESQARYHDLFENASDIVFTLDLDGNFTSYNRAAKQIAGCSTGGSGRANISEIVAPGQSRLVRQMMDLKLLDPRPTSYELEVVARDGSTLTLEVNSRLMVREGKPIGIQGIARDVTEARALTNRLAQSVAELEAVHGTAISLNTVHDLEGILRQTLLGVKRLSVADRARILVLSRDAGTFALCAEIDAGGSVEITPVDRAPGPLTRAILDERRGRFVGDVEAEHAPLSSSMTACVQAYAGLPLQTSDRSVGVLYVTYNHPHTFSADSRQLMQVIAAHASVAIANVQMLEEARAAAVTDVLTGLPNHRHLMDRLDQEMDRARRSGHPMAVMMMDIDDFKLVNDTHGHPVGDRLLRQVAQVVQNALRSTDVVGRYGGDEFLAILPETDRTEAETVADRIIEQVRALQFRVESDEAGAAPHQGIIPVHVSIGTAVYPHDSAVRLELISLADTAMYASKRGGGNASTSARVTDSAFLAAQNTTFGVLEGLVNSVDAKDRYTRLHSEQVAERCLAAAEVMGLSPEVKRRLRIASLLHDVGKIGIPDRILRKPGSLTGEEFDIVRQHTVLGEMIIREVPQLTDVLDAVRHHHERYDGAGYPRGMKGEEIPMLARLIAIADAYSAMTLDRPYRQALSAEEAIAELRRGAGTQFDPDLLEPFLEALNRKSGRATLEIDHGPSDLQRQASV